MKALKIFALLILSIVAVSGAEITIEANKTVMPKGDVVKLDIYVNGTDVTSALFNLSYEPTKLSLIDRVNYGVFEEEQFKTGANYVAFIGFGGSVSGKTKIASLSFKAVGVATTTNITPISSAVNGSTVALPEKVMITILDYEVLYPTWRDPFAISVAGMPSFSSLPVDDPSDGINWTKVDLPSDCKNGVGGNTFIMVRKGSENKLLIYLEGGGACSSFGTCGGPNSTVTTLEPAFDTGTRPLKSTYVRGIFDVKNPLNPFRNWTIVFVPYGTGDIHMGNRVVKYYNTSNPAESKTIYHVGYVNAIVAMRWINASGNFDKVVVTGTSAGGFGTILHFYRASEIFNKGIIAINDAGPGTAPNVTSPLQPAVTAEKWGSLQNYPQQSLPYFTNTDTIKFLNWALNGSAGGCGNCIYALFEDQWDFIIGPYFQGYSFADYQARLLSAIESVKANFSTRFCYYLPLSTYHTAFAGGYNYPGGDRFYNLHIDGYTLVQWINDVLNGNCVDRKDDGIRDLRVELLSAPTSAIVGNTYNITVRVSNIGSNATPDPFFVILSNRTAILGYQVLTLSANSNVTFNFTWTPTTAGTEQLNVTVDGLLVPALGTLLPFGSVVELYGFPVSEANNTIPRSIGVCRVDAAPVTVNNWLTPYDVVLGMLPKTANVTLPDGSVVAVNVQWLSITDPEFTQFTYTPTASAFAPSYIATGKAVIPAVCPGEVTVRTNVTVATPLLPIYWPNAGIYPDGRPLNISDRTLFNQPGKYEKVTISFGGLDRTYYYYVPTSYSPDKPAPLVLVFHGGGSLGLAQMLAVDDFAEKYGFILVTPDGYGWTWNRTRDVPFVAKIIEDMQASFNIDKSRIYATGISMGGIMTTYVLYDLSDKIAAVGIVSGSRILASELTNGTLPPRPMTVVISAGTGERILGNPIYEHLNARNATKLLVQAWNCNSTPETKFWPNSPNDPNTNVTRYVYTGCKNGVKVVYFEVGNGGHAWMGGLQYVIPASIGWVTKHVNAWDDRDGMWAYLKEEYLPTPTATPTPRPPAGGGGVGGGVRTEEKFISLTTQYIVLKAGERNVYAVPETAYIGKDVIYIASITLIPAESTDVKINIKRYTELPPGVPRIEAVAVAIFEINLDMSKATSVSGEIEFAVPVEALKGIDPKSVVALRLVDGRWVEIPTKFLGEKDGFYHFLAETPGFSYFALAVKPTTPTPTTPTPTTPTPTATPTATPTPTPKPLIPGFEAIFAIAGLLAIAYLLRRRQ
ncbi:MAG: pectin acetylesterase-family hydrolase [Archaeoglobaceae archaeon]